MQLHTFKDVEHMQADHVFRTSAWTMLMLPVVLLAICVALAWALLTGFLPVFFWLSFVLIAPFVPLVFFTNFVPSLRPSNWVVKVRGNRLFLMLRNFRERHFSGDGPTVVSFEFGEIASVGKLTQQLSAPSSSGRRYHATQQQLEIRFCDDLPVEFTQAYSAERNRKPPAVGFVRRTSYYTSPVTIADQKTIRVLWRGRFDVVKPSIDRALHVLEQYVTRHDEQKIDRRQPENLSEAEFDDLILHLCDTGNRIDAVKLLREHRGYTLTEAKQFVDEVCSSPSPTWAET